MCKVNIGLEIHAELKTDNKMFCSCLNNPEVELPNVNVCPVCLGEPGALPVTNKEAIEKTIKVALACHSKISQFSFFERKSYFYPDLPKAYQISQFQHPIGLGGYLEINLGDQFKKIGIKEIHLEEDTAKLTRQKDGTSLIDFNRSSVPLMELVTGPNISSPQEAKAFGQELQIILRYLGVSNANMEKGEMRVEANISIRFESEDLGTKIEIKNLNSFRAVEKAIEYEIKRQIEVLKSGGQVIQETRGWDEVRKKTFSQRIKEGAAGYRYFPDPDLLPFKIRDEDLKRIKSSLVELPYQKRRRYLEEYQLPLQQINAIVEEREKAEFFEGIIGDIRDKKFIKLASNYFTSDLAGLIQKYKFKISEIKFKKVDFINLINLILEGKIQSFQAKVILEEMVKSGASPEKIIQDKGYKQISNQDLEKVIAQILIKNKAVVEDYKNGKEKALQFLIGSAMRETKGQASPNTLKNLLRRLLK